MSLEVMVKGIYPIDDLAKRFPTVKALRDISLKKCDDIRWNFNNNDIFDLQVMFIGKTGYGKSSTINFIVGEDILRTSDIQACTKRLYSIEYRLPGNDEFFSLNDLPGIGESTQSDQAYYEWYRDMLTRSCCVVYVLRADQRDFSIDEILFRAMFQTSAERKKVILAMNFADKVEPVNRKGGITQEQIRNLKLKANTLKKIFDIENIVYYSAGCGYHVDLLVEKIVKVSVNSLFIE